MKLVSDALSMCDEMINQNDRLIVFLLRKTVINIIHLVVDSFMLIYKFFIRA